MKLFENNVTKIKSKNPIWLISNLLKLVLKAVFDTHSMFSPKLVLQNAQLGYVWNEQNLNQATISNNNLLTFS